MPELNISLLQLRGMIGKQVLVGTRAYQVIEVLEFSQELVLQHSLDGTDIQPNQHGDANRRVPATTTVPVLTADRNEFHPAFLALDLIN
ncbi:hypothetical protein MNBD_GAMMA21-828 [hydrothermal vent metagenome]|uniref:Uncharacterized protein n=1 Tax=hydrothermal vent metagenome TaxID=652676 RepID=A0A3B0ZU13_9ZZZZ